MCHAVVHSPGLLLVSFSSDLCIHLELSRAAIVEQTSVTIEEKTFHETEKVVVR